MFPEEIKKLIAAYAASLAMISFCFLLFAISIYMCSLSNNHKHIESKKISEFIKNEGPISVKPLKSPKGMNGISN